eukprot:PhF_6_TR34223/c0_g1_i18/m.50231
MLSKDGATKLLGPILLAPEETDASYEDDYPHTTDRNYDGNGEPSLAVAFRRTSFGVTCAYSMYINAGTGVYSKISQFPGACSVREGPYLVNLGANTHLFAVFLSGNQLIVSYLGGSAAYVATKTFATNVVCFGIDPVLDKSGNFYVAWADLANNISYGLYNPTTSSITTTTYSIGYPVIAMDTTFIAKGGQYMGYYYSKNNMAYFGSIGICPGVVGPVDYFSVNAQLLGHIGMVHNADAIHTVYYTIYNSTLQGFVTNFMVVVKCTGEYTTQLLAQEVTSSRILANYAANIFMY